MDLINFFFNSSENVSDKKSSYDNWTKLVESNIEKYKKMHPNWMDGLNFKNPEDDDKSILNMNLNESNYLNIKEKDNESENTLEIYGEKLNKYKKK